MASSHHETIILAVYHNDGSIWKIPPNLHIRRAHVEPLYEREELPLFGKEGAGEIS